MFKVGDTVLNEKGEQVRIICTNKKPSEFPIVGLATQHKHEALVVYTAEGCVYTGQNPSLEDLVRPVDWSKVAVDTPVWVSDDKIVWAKAHFAQVEERDLYVYQNGRTKFTSRGSISYEYMSLTNPET